MYIKALKTFRLPMAMVCVAGGHFVESVLPLYLYVDFRDLAKQVPLPAGPSQMPESFYIRYLNGTIIKK